MDDNNRTNTNITNITSPTMEQVITMDTEFTNC